MLVNAKDMLTKAFKGKYAIPQFNINNLEWAKYILEECDNLDSPVILGVSEGAIKYMGGYKTVFKLIEGLISDLKIKIPVVLHLDHGSSVESCKKAIDNGFTSVMIDASKYELRKNIQITKEVIDYARLYNVTVEAEIGHIGEVENKIKKEVLYASVEDCKKIKNETNIDFLAPALGSVHGLYKGKPKLDFKRMKEIKEAINIPLVLHGGTGIFDYQIKKAIDNGIAKININTELQVAWNEKVRCYLKENKDVYDPRKIIGSGQFAIKEKIREKIILFRNGQ
ncbi:MAG: class II fructose-1,6-bisphosphate aldolase [Bacilli bacterium]|jgi:fructose-1,6-bisphosphate aldolase class II